MKTNRVTIHTLRAQKQRGERISMLTAYDATFARLLDEAGIDVLLVGDSLGMVVQGYPNPLPVTLAEMLYHTRCVLRGTRRALVIGDMPFLSYSTIEEALENAGRFLQDGGSQAVKIEGGQRSGRIVEALAKSGVPVMGHIGWTPQSQHGLGGKVKVQGKSRDAARSLLSDAIAIQEAGAFSIVLELVPEQLAAVITSRLRIPTIGIGAGPHCSGQVQVIPDMLGLGDFHPKHARAYADLQGTIAAATKAWMADVAAGSFPGPAETVRMDDAVLDEALGRTADDRAPGAVDRSAAQMIPLDRDL